MRDPFTQIARTILRSLLADSAWAALVRPGNVIDMTSDTFEQFKSKLQPGDVPEVILLQGDFTLRPFGGNSRIATLEQSYGLITTHDSLRVAPVNALKYLTLVALTKVGPSLGLEGLVRGWEITQSTDDALGQKHWRRGTQRWVSLLSIRVSMYLPREMLTASA